MTDHLDEGLIQAFLDGELDARAEARARAHLAECPSCREVSIDLERASRVVTDSLALLSTGTPSTEKVWQRVKRAHASAGSRAGPGGVPSVHRTAGRGGLFSLARAAGIAFLLVAGLASALPGSPVRRWIEAGWERWVTEEAGEATPPGVEAPEIRVPPPAEGKGEVGAGVGVVEGGVDVVIRGLPRGADVRIVLVRGTRARVYGPRGTRFRTEEGRIEAISPGGTVRVELPEAASRSRVTVNGEVYLRKTGDHLEVLGPVRTRGEAEIRFRSGAEGAGIEGAGR